MCFSISKVQLIYLDLCACIVHYLMQNVPQQNPKKKLNKLKNKIPSWGDVRGRREK